MDLVAAGMAVAGDMAEDVITNSTLFLSYLSNCHRLFVWSSKRDRDALSFPYSLVGEFISSRDFWGINLEIHSICLFGINPWRNRYPLRTP